MKIDVTEYKSLINGLIDTHTSFEICGVDISDMLQVCSDLEQTIENKYLKCRIYTKNRLVTGLSGVLNYRWGVLSLASIVAHNILTLNPDYEIVRDLANNRVEVVWVG
ncbi:hypothetical protein [Phocoenobacter skyensis]|uniref:Uncharacterized protein n=1 Tax=Phocoenobacter skyensis TaxID=97481 RepID=A0A1H7TXI6_9PAST|nr:hypothetical protein [Pasteurella skyensis]MDP8078646.1 hypothetical protein [Pasteurella skyensis]MDP8084640.1 hypothetical protein [Pasteurella skyensis]MDP8184214.1 hypothetical protein [Pasteurella skyensis]QLB22867.1 hypothetical protein A6B44_06455 [Pasteurella skyensis]SEL89264.1 hypothetical protein SAMN05444853_10154 [Pasteurella skyensis]